MKSLRSIFFAAFFFSAHAALLTYINSSMLERSFSSATISIVYTTGSMLSLILVFFVPKFLRTLGLMRVSALALIASACSLVIVGNSSSDAALLIPAFVIYFSFNSLVFYLFDVLIEHYANKKTLGNIRGIYLTFNNIAWVGAPAIAGIIAGGSGFGSAYLIAAGAVLITAVILIITQRNFVDPEYKREGPGKIFTLIRTNPILRRSISINFILQFFYCWMVIYAPLYLRLTLGFDYKTIGLIFSVMLIPFVLLQYPMGRLADRIGEKYIIIVGIIIAAITTGVFSLGYITSPFWCAVILFMTRIGASITEVSVDSYFFKHVNDTDTSLMSTYRNMLPLAYIVGPMAASFVIIWYPYQTLFSILSLLLVVGAVYAFRLKEE